jgi:CRISPR-associated protein Cas1
MAATQTVSQHLQHCNLAPILPRHGVITLFGYGIKVHVDRGHLTIQDGIGTDRREARLPRVGHGLRRLVVISSDGMVSLAALCWLADQDAAFVMLDRDGSVLATTGPVRSSDARLRRAQAFAEESGAAVQITKQLIAQKLLGQERVAREGLNDLKVAEQIAGFQGAVD